jgi:hypothetical protein
MNHWLSGYFGIFRDNIPEYDGINGIFPFREYPVSHPAAVQRCFYPVCGGGA